MIRFLLFLLFTLNLSFFTIETFNTETVKKVPIASEDEGIVRPVRMLDVDEKQAKEDKKRNVEETGIHEVHEQLKKMKIEQYSPEERKNNEEFLIAVEKNDIKAVNDILNLSNVDIDSRDNNLGQTALIKAAYKGYVQMVRLLIDKGADISAESRMTKNNALNWSVIQGHTNIAKLLIAAGADINFIDREGRKALFFAWRDENEEIANLLKTWSPFSAEFHADKKLGYPVFTALLNANSQAKKKFEEKKKLQQAQTSQYIIPELAGLITEYAQEYSFKDWISVVHPEKLNEFDKDLFVNLDLEVEIEKVPKLQNIVGECPPYISQYHMESF